MVDRQPISQLEGDTLVMVAAAGPEVESTLGWGSTFRLPLPSASAT